MAQAGVSTNGVTFSYGIGGNSRDGAKPSDMTLLDRTNTIGGISITDEVIDASALEDLFTRNIKGRGDTGGSVPITVNVTDETIKEWKAVIAAHKGLTSSQGLWFQTIIPGLTDSFWFIAEPPSIIPQPEIAQNGLLTVEMNMTISDYVGDSTVVEPTANPVVSPGET
jgi:hypothetical protein